MPGFKLMKCPLCKGTVHTCKCQDEGKSTLAVTVKNKKGKTKHVPHPEGHFTKNGSNWCGRCNCRLNPSGVCSNLKCSSRKGK